MGCRSSIVTSVVRLILTTVPLGAALALAVALEEVLEVALVALGTGTSGASLGPESASGNRLY